MKETVEQITSNLKLFIGSVNIYYDLVSRKIGYTEGVKYLCDSCESYWFLTDVLVRAENLLEKNDFIVISLYRNKGESNCYVTYTDGNDNELHRKEYEYTDFPLYNIASEPAIELFCTNGVLYLPSEH